MIIYFIPWAKITLGKSKIFKKVDNYMKNKIEYKNKLWEQRALLEALIKQNKKYFNFKVQFLKFLFV